MGNGAYLFLGGVALGAVVGAAMSFVLTAAAPPAESVAPAARQDADRLAAVFEDAFTRALRRTERGRVREDSPAPRSDASPPDPALPAPAGAAPAAGPGPSPVAPPPARAEPARRSDAYMQDADEALPPKNTARVNALLVRTVDARTRRDQAWLFQSEAAVARSLGTPDGVSLQKDGTEEWTYHVLGTNAAGEADEWSVDFKFSRGRVIEVGGAEEIPDE